MTNLAGTWFICPTPFDERGTVDVASIQTLVDAARRWAVDGVTILGVMGEAPALSDAERREVLAATAAATAGTLPFAVGCSSASAALTASRAAEAHVAGAAAVMIAAPPLAKDTDTLGAYFAAATAECPLPVIVQDEPAATGVNLPVSALLAALDATRGTIVKLEDPPTPPKIARLLAERPELTVFGGLGGTSAYGELSHGAAGTMTGFAFPEVLRAVRLAFEAGDRATAGRIFDRFLPYIAFEGQPRIGLAIRKEVLRRRGAIANSRTRNVISTPDKHTLDDLDDVLDRVGIVPSPQAMQVSA